MDVLKKNEIPEALDPDTLQRQASNPDESVWVGASAGTGKTKVLTDRVLRLLLPRWDGRPGTPANRILCLTFTKAAANEMAIRINGVLSQWAVMSHEELQESLKNLLGDEATNDQFKAAQRLFADVIDCPGGLKIMTIHSFCQSVLGRFPLEADLPPNFEMLDEQKAFELMQQAIKAVLKESQSDGAEGSVLSLAVHRLATDLDEETFTNLIRSVCQESHQLFRMFEQYQTVEMMHAKICDHYNVEQGLSFDDVVTLACNDEQFDRSSLGHAAEALLQDKGKKAPIYGQIIKSWINAGVEQRVATFSEYLNTFLNKDGQPRSQAFPPKGALDIDPQCGETLQIEAVRLMDLQEKRKRLKSAQMTADILIIGKTVLDRFTDIKQRQGVLDFDDLIIRTMALLKGKTNSLEGLSGKGYGSVTPWVMYKLDQGLDHILVDEAQDTNPDQWRIIDALSEEFFAGLGARDEIMRSSFVVGDVKQSIYSFQRAEPQEFQKMQRLFEQKIKAADQVSRNVELDISFRSTSSVLRVVDNVFEEAQLREALGGEVVQHVSHRKGQAGMVELWPLIEDAAVDQKEFWEPPLTVVNSKSGSAQLAAKTAQNIRNWLDRKEKLESCDRTIKPGDIMILVRSRTAFVDQLIRELKSKNIPVSGSDRMVLNDHLAVQDLLAIARFSLLPEDDLTLACVLKSPLLKWTEEEVFSLAYKRNGTLWQELCNFDESRFDGCTDKIDIVANDKREQARDYLSRVAGRGKFFGAYEFFSFILNTACPADSFSGLRAVQASLGEDAIDPLDELLNAALSFSRDDVDHLQNFVDAQERHGKEIKREMDESGDQVRIMTIHGSKGLQAPIVIMPDTIKSSAAKKTGRMLWPNKTGLGLPVFSPRKEDDPDVYKALYQGAQEQEDEEYYRLLYVAMTRAADRLYIGGYLGSKGALDSSWYYKIKAAMERDEQCITDEAGNMRIENAQTAEPDKAKKAQAVDHKIEDLPDWIFKNAPEEPFPPRPLIPSRPSIDDAEAAMSPLLAQDNKRFRRGNVTHKLLQFLPDFDEDVRRNVAQKFVQRNAADLSENVQQSIVSEVMSILENPEYKPFFNKNSAAEVSVTGLMGEDRIVSGQIDRLVIEENDIWIVDYKTNRPPPKNPEDIPKIYYKQMAAYRDSIQEIYPNHTIHCALLWTDGPFLTRVEKFDF